MKKTIAELRQEINDVDEQLVKFLAQRFTLTQKIGLLKKETTQPIEDPTRNQEMKNRQMQLAKLHTIKPEIVDQIFEKIIALSIKEQTS
jgi:chorismate mutase